MPNDAEHQTAAHDNVVSFYAHLPPGETDCVLQGMIKRGVPITRQNYLDLAYPNGIPEDWGAELEAELPPVIQRMPR